MATNKDLTILQGSTFSVPVRWMNGDQIIRKPITGISIASGAPRLTVVGHGCPNGWPTAVTLVKGMTPINAKNAEPKGADYRVTTVIDTDTLEYLIEDTLEELIGDVTVARRWSKYLKPATEPSEQG